LHVIVIASTGSVPAIIGAAQGIKTIGISNDESAANAVVGPAENEWPPSPLANLTVSLTPSSTGELVAKECFAQNGIANLSGTFTVDRDQPFGVLNELEGGTADFGGLWAPYLYTYLEGGEGRFKFCDGSNVGIVVPGAIIVNEAWAEANPDTVAKVLAAWLRGIEFVKNPDNHEVVLGYMTDFYFENDITLSVDAMEQDVETRRLFGLDEQIDIMDNQAGEWFTDIAEFMNSVGVVENVPAAGDYLTSKYMSMVKADDTLSGYASNEQQDLPTDSPAGESSGGATSRCTVVGLGAAASFSFVLAWV